MTARQFLTVATFAVFSATALAQEVSYDIDKRASFSQLRTYAWVDGTPLIDPLNHRRIVNAVDTQLAAKGLVRVEVDAAPDALVAYHASLDTNITIKGVGRARGDVRVAAPLSGSATTQDLLIGTLALDIMNAKSKTVVWRATVTNEIDSYASAEKRERNITAAAEKAFWNYPPKQ